jgi:hypothetical protein
MAAPLGFKTFNTGDVLSAADTNGYLMQGIWVFADATARDAAVTSPQEGNSCYLKDTDVIQVYSGSSWVVKSGGSSPLTTKGDLYTYSTTDARLAVGANGTTLVADSSTATGLKWDTPASGGMTLLETLSLSGSSVTSGTLSSSYKQFLVYITELYGSAEVGMQLRLNEDTGSNYKWSFAASDGSSWTLDVADPSTIFRIGSSSTDSTTRRRAFGIFTITRPSDTNIVFINSNFTFRGGSAALQSITNGVYDSSAAITKITIFPSSGTMTAGTAYIYGVN